jgi:DNA-binding CsgD family transcriptional regulator
VSARRSPQTYARAARNMLQHDLVRGALCVALLFVLLLAGTPIWLALALPFISYGGMRLLLNTGPEMPLSAPQPIATLTDHAAYARCVEVQQRIHGLAGSIDEPRMSSQLTRITVLIDQILDVITEDASDEDAKDEVSGPLLALMQTTVDLLTHYGKLVRRGFDDAEVQERVRSSLATLDDGYEEFWTRINRIAVVDLEALSEMIDEMNKRLPLPPEAHQELPARAAGPAQSVPPEIAKLIASLTPRQYTILCMLPSGKTDQEIADLLFNAKRTVTTHIGEIYAKINVRNRAEAVAFAVRWGLV